MLTVINSCRFSRGNDTPFLGAQRTLQETQSVTVMGEMIDGAAVCHARLATHQLIQTMAHSASTYSSIIMSTLDRGSVRYRTIASVCRVGGARVLNTNVSNDVRDGGGAACAQEQRTNARAALGRVRVDNMHESGSGCTRPRAYRARDPCVIQTDSSTACAHTSGAGEVSSLKVRVEPTRTTGGDREGG